MTATIIAQKGKLVVLDGDGLYLEPRGTRLKVLTVGGYDVRLRLIVDGHFPTAEVVKFQDGVRNLVGCEVERDG